MSAAAKLASASYSWRGITARLVLEICVKAFRQARHMTAGPSRSTSVAWIALSLFADKVHPRYAP